MKKFWKSDSKIFYNFASELHSVILNKKQFFFFCYLHVYIINTSNLLNISISAFFFYTHCVNKYIYQIDKRTCHVEHELVYAQFLPRTGRFPGEGQISVCSSNMVRPSHQFSNLGERKGRAKGGFTVRSAPWQESGRVLSVLGPEQASVDEGRLGYRAAGGSRVRNRGLL